MRNVIPELPRNVVLHSAEFEDRSMGQRYPLNTTAQVFLALVV